MGNVNYTPEDVVSHRGIAAVIKNDKGEILMQEHVKYGFWTLPVGKVKKEQNVEEGLKEELFEECNIFVKNFREIEKKEFVYNRAGNKISVFAHLFEIEDYEGEIKNKEPDKHKQQVFLSLSKIKELPYLSDLTLLYLKNIGLERAAKI